LFNSAILLLSICSADLKFMSTQSLQTNICNCFIHNYETLQATKVTFSSWVDKWAVVQPHNGVLLAKEKSKLASHEKTWRKLKRTLLSERSWSEKAAYCIALPMLYSSKNHILDTIKISVISRNLGEGFKGWMVSEGQWNYSLCYYNSSNKMSVFKIHTTL
jgi:hypothetical protein